ncbi:pentapeptide repeat-containing protein [uncultured Gardnerella sp.]|uniref:pentapeptide repeat-containing protein n=1 Tax=uncultured Gardnerella sp. TaxID=293424 RepID=UPI00344C200A
MRHSSWSYLNLHHSNLNHSNLNYSNLNYSNLNHSNLNYSNLIHLHYLIRSFYLLSLLKTTHKSQFKIYTRQLIN